jgi:hypothetical protein
VHAGSGYLGHGAAPDLPAGTVRASVRAPDGSTTVVVPPPR